LKRKILSLLLVLALTLCFAAPVMAADVPTTIGVYTNTVNLDNKTPAWALTPGDSIGGTLGYNPSGSTFVYGLYATGLSDGDYSLIYYADTTTRFVNWGGDNPGAVIAAGSSSGGVLSMSGSVELGMDLPCPPDANAYFYNYTIIDGYVNATGAKVWLVPTSALSSGGVMPVSAWPQTSDWLFETDLIAYDDTDVVSTIVGISVNPTSLNFGIISPGSTASAGDVTVTSVSNVSVDVSATVDSAPSVFQYTLLGGSAVSAYNITLPYTTPASSDTVAVTLPVPTGYTPTGTETGTLTFTATATTP